MTQMGFYKSFKVRGDMKTGQSESGHVPILPFPKPKLVVAQTPSEAKLAAALVSEKSGSVRCIYCAGVDVVKRGLRKKKLETVQLYFCHHCNRTFVWQRIKGKKFPLRIILEGLSLYNMGFTMEELIDTETAGDSSRGETSRIDMFKAKP